MYSAFHVTNLGLIPGTPNKIQSLPGVIPELGQDFSSNGCFREIKMSKFSLYILFIELVSKY